jgi:hypothetical protein
MISQRSCPICQSESLEQVLRGTTFMAVLGGEMNPLTGVTSYRCPDGHLFMIVLPQPEPLPSAKNLLPVTLCSREVR